MTSLDKFEASKLRMFEAFNDFDEHQDKYGIQCNVMEFDEAKDDANKYYAN
jgi:hypothetical protein